VKRSDLVLAVLASAEGGALSPVQVQKLFFILDMRIPGPQADPTLISKLAIMVRSIKRSTKSLRAMPCTVELKSSGRDLNRTAQHRRDRLKEWTF
jgi:hypothetical protein